MSTLRTDNIRTLNDALNIPLTNIALKTDLVASTIAVTPTGSISQTNVQAALAGLDTRVNAKQPLHSNLTALAGTTTSANTMFYWTSPTTVALATVTPFARTVLDDADAATMRATLGTTSLIQGTAQNTTSGTSFDFTGIPAGVKRITVMLNAVSTNGTSTLQVQMGAGSIETTGYQSSVLGGVPGNVIAGVSIVSGMICAGTITAAGTNVAVLVLTNVSGNIWIMTGTNVQYTTGAGFLLSGLKTLAGTLDRVRLTTVNGTDLFDAGSVNILYEG